MYLNFMIQYMKITKGKVLVVEFKRCERCGSFFAGINSVCNNCIEKENLDLSKLKNYFEESGEESANDINNNIDSISYATGITAKNLTRQLQSEIIFKDLRTKF